MDTTLPDSCPSCGQAFRDPVDAHRGVCSPCSDKVETKEELTQEIEEAAQGEDLEKDSGHPRKAHKKSKR